MKVHGGLFFLRNLCFVRELMVLVVISDLLICLSSAFRRRPLTAWSRSLWGWTASCQEACRPLWPSTLWPTRCPDNRSASGFFTDDCDRKLQSGRPSEQTWETKIRKQAVSHLHFFIYVFIYSFDQWKQTNAPPQKKDLFLWSGSKRKLGNTVSVLKLASRFFCLVFEL